ncbi:MAG: sigma-54 dependent transcriptional regulator, partial [Pseudohongiellaceae bacterium]
VLMGSLTGLPVAAFITSVKAWNADAAFVLTRGSFDNQTDAEASTATVAGDTSLVATVNQPWSYQSLMDALHKARLYHQRERNGGESDHNAAVFHSLVGSSSAIAAVRRMMSQVADKEVSVLITGESGTGKEVVARNLHRNSLRAGKPFVPINCGAIPAELLESELFGHEKGAFTGAVASRIGRFELADGGTLFLDEIGDMPPGMQVKLLRVLQEQAFERVGGVKTISTDVRIIAATHQNLETMISRSDFRQDLYYRLNVFPIDVPPLRERIEDIPLLLNELISQLETSRRGSVRFNSCAIAAMCTYPWPGNIRELANLVERMAILHPHGIIGLKNLPEKFGRAAGIPTATSDNAVAEASIEAQDAARQDPPSALLPLSGLDLKQYLGNLEQELIEQALGDSDGVVARAAERLHIRRTTLVEKMRKYNLLRKSEQDEDQFVRVSE